MTTPTNPVRLDKTPIHLGDGRDAVVLRDFSFSGDGFERYIAKHTTADAPGRLVMMERSLTSWATWERHPAGDELVIVVSGKAELIQQLDGGERRTLLGPGDAIVNPAGVWHTADIIEPVLAVYVTPCPGTDHKPR